MTPTKKYLAEHPQLTWHCILWRKDAIYLGCWRVNGVPGIARYNSQTQCYGETCFIAVCYTSKCHVSALDLCSLYSWNSNILQH